MYYEEDAPRSARSVGYGSPRDDRFYTPRTVARSNSNSNSEEWVTPRYETPRFGNNGYNSQSDNEFQTPRTYDERKLESRKEMYPTLLKRASLSNESPRIHDSPYAAQGKGSHQREYGSKELGQKEGGHYPPSYAPSYLNQTPAPYQAQSKQIEEEDEHDEEYISLDLAAAGLSEKDVEDVFSYARHGRCEEIERLFAKGLPVDVRNDHGNTVLIVACQNGNKRVAKAVLRRGANINARNHRGNTPLHYCYHYGYGDSLGQYLISKGADPDARNNAGKTIDQGI